MTQNKITAPVPAHRNGQTHAALRPHLAIASHLRDGVKIACVTMGLYIAAAVAALNLPAMLLGVLVLNALLGIWFALDEEVAS